MQRMIPKRLGLKFQFTRRLRAAISSITSLADLPSDISIHATHTGRDNVLNQFTSAEYDFNSRDPYGPRSDSMVSRLVVGHFNSRDPYGPRLMS